MFLLDLTLRELGARQGAVELVRRAPEAFPGDFWISYDLGVALLDSRPPQSEEAVRYLSVAAALRPKSVGVRLNLGAALAESGRLVEASSAYRQAIQLRPDSVRAYHKLGLVLWRRGELTQALRVWVRGYGLGFFGTRPSSSGRTSAP